MLSHTQDPLLLSLTPNLKAMGQRHLKILVKVHHREIDLIIGHITTALTTRTINVHSTKTPMITQVTTGMTIYTPSLF